VGEAAPDLEFFGPKVVTLNGQRIPTLRITTPERRMAA